MRIVDDGPEREDFAVPALRGWERLVAGAVGLVLTLLGLMVALGTTHDWTSVTLCVAGAVFLLVAVTGYAVSGLKVGGNELALQRIVRRAEQAFSQGDDSEGKRLLETIVPNAVSALDYEREVLMALERVVPPGTEVAWSTTWGPARFDGALLRKDRSRVIVEIFHGSRFTGTQLIGKLAQARANGLDAAGLLVIVNGRPRLDVVERLKSIAGEYPLRVEVVTWLDGRDDETLRNAVEALLK